MSGVQPLFGHVGVAGSGSGSADSTVYRNEPFLGVGSGPELPATSTAVFCPGAIPAVVGARDGRSARRLDRDLERRASETGHLAAAPDLRSEVRAGLRLDEVTALRGRGSRERKRGHCDCAQEK